MRKLDTKTIVVASHNAGKIREIQDLIGPLGFTAKSVTPAILSGPVEGEIWVEQEKWIAKTNNHFAVTVDDATYRRMRSEVEFWGHHPGKFYDLDSNNCISFVGKIAQMAGLKVDYPKNLMRKPRAWLNHIAALNPQLHAKAING